MSGTFGLIVFNETELFKAVLAAAEESEGESRGGGVA